MSTPSIRSKRADTKLVHGGRTPAGIVNPPVTRASTVLFETLDSYDKAQSDRFAGLFYGIYGTETMFRLEEALTEIEGCHRAIVLPSGLAAITAPLFAAAGHGDHVLVGDNVYGPTRAFCDGLFAKAGVETTYFDPMIGEGIEALIRPQTKAVFMESPGTYTFEVADIPAIASVTRRHGIPLMLDNTWGTPLFFDALRHGVDISIQAGTKYLNGHSDILMGVVATTEEWWRPVRDAAADLGFSTSPDDCYLALRGLRTMGLRMRHQFESALEITRWLREQDGVESVLYPPLPGDPHHELWRRDFTGGASLFGLELATDDREAMVRFVEALDLFKIGASWGGYESLIRPASFKRTAEGGKRTFRQLLRLHVGLEDVEDLKADLTAGLSAMKAG